METSTVQAKNQKVVRTLCWSLIVLSIILMLKALFHPDKLSELVTTQGTTKDLNPPIKVNSTLYYIEFATGVLLSLIVTVSASFALSFKDLGRKILVYALTLSVIHLMLSPIINYYYFDVFIPGLNSISVLIWTYVRATIVSIFAVVVIIRFSKGEVKQLFK